MSERVKIVVFVPVAHTGAVLGAMGEAGAGKIGNYSNCSFVTRGTGRFKPEAGADPAVGRVGVYEQVKEDRIEMVCERAVLKEVIEAVKKIHPYEEVALDVYPLESI